MRVDLSLGEEEVLLRITDKAARIAAWLAPDGDDRENGKNRTLSVRPVRLRP